MPHGKKKGGAARSAPRGMSIAGARSTFSQFRIFKTQGRTAAGDTFGRLDLTCPNLGNRGASMAPMFEFFRIVRLHVYSTLGCAGAKNIATEGGDLIHAVAFLAASSTEDSAPASEGTMSQAQHYRFSNGYMQARMNVGPKDLYESTPEKMYSTYTTGTPLDQQSAGQVIYHLGMGSASNVSVTQFVVIEGIVEFILPIDPTLSFARIAQFKVLLDAADDELRAREESETQGREPAGIHDGFMVIPTGPAARPVAGFPPPRNVPSTTARR